MKNKKLLTILLAAVVVAAGVIFALTSVEEKAGTSALTMTADKESYKPGETVTCTVALGPTSDLVGLKFLPGIPEGLTYVENSGAAAEGLQEKMNAVKVEFVEKSGAFVLLGDTAYTSEEETVLMTFRCTVDPEASGELTLGFAEDKLECFNMDNEDIDCPMEGVTIRVES